MREREKKRAEVKYMCSEGGRKEKAEVNTCVVREGGGGKKRAEVNTCVMRKGGKKGLRLIYVYFE
jgi:hypothetical protein